MKRRLKAGKIACIAVLLLLLVGTFLPHTARAEDDEPGGLEEILSSMNRAINVLVLIAGGITTLLLIWCVFMWQKEKAENPDSQEAADWKSRGVKVLVGLVIILMARTIVAVVEWVALG